jgi:HYR domain
MKSSHLPTRSSPVHLACTVVLALIGMATIANAQNLPCIETNGVKFILPPQTDGGWDVRDSQGPIVLADDFFCNTNGPITDIHLWGSWISNNHGQITNFWLGIYNDVPAITNFSSGQVTNSHPGTNLLWQQSFGPGQYAESVYGTGSEQFYDPQAHSIIGSDTAVYYYCFYPTNPFVQQGTANRPTNYWLAVRAQLADPLPIMFGWKTTQIPYNDAAVWGNVQPATGLPIGNWQSMTNPLSQQPLHLSMKLTTPTNSTPTPCCPETNGVKYLQRPNLQSGFDVDASQTIWLADDFKCTNSGPITDIHLWGSWINDLLDAGATFTLGIWSDVPAGGTFSSHPGNNLWYQTFGPGQYAICPYINAPESFYQPNAAGLSFKGQSTNLYYLCFFPANPFKQTGSPNQPTNYWLSINVQTSPGFPYDFGWKTSQDSYNDPAVWGTGPFPGSWFSLFDPFFGLPLNFSFKITTQTNPPSPTVCVETNGVKYVQWPNLFGGLDVWNSSSRPIQVTDGPWWLADDFICTNTGPITDIHLWGSWQNDQALPGSITFQLYVFDDVPANAANPFSHPGTNVLWHQTFAPGSYAETVWTANAAEYFFDPGPPTILGGDSVVWYYCFNPTNLAQYGSTSQPTNYWLAAFAELPTGTTNVFGWKTTTNVQHDISVHSQWLGFGVSPTNSLGWTPTHDVTGLPVDLAFKLTTPTNQCPLPVIQCSNQVIQCGTAWAIIPPPVFDQCCPVPNPVTLAAAPITNGTACSEVVTLVWKYTDCLGRTVNCSETVTVVDTTPPVITCPTDKTVECGTSWAFGTPTATDACCTAAVTITNLSTVTNTTGPCQQIITRTWQATDCCSNSSTCSQTVTVADTTPPTITCPSNIVVFTCDTNAIVLWSILATDKCSSVTVTSTPPSGTAFQPNTTNTVTATARDACGNTSSCTFTVAIRRPVLGPIFINRFNTNIVVLTWTNGFLQVSTNVIGPYVDVPGATSPYTNTTLSMPPTNRFYRLRCNSP